MVMLIVTIVCYIVSYVFRFSMGRWLAWLVMKLNYRKRAPLFVFVLTVW